MLPKVADFLAGRDPTFARITVDPFLDDWDPERGRRQAFAFRNRYGATLTGHAFIADTARRRSGRLPAVILIPGFGAYEQVHWGLAQGLAESGYLVVTVDPQGQGQSDVDPSPLERFCDPEGSWRRPQEMGLRERGECAGHYPPIEGGLSPAVIATLLRGPTSALDGGEGLRSDLREGAEIYVQIRTNAVFAALDTVEWVRSRRNPVRRLVDPRRIGVVGHSLGANGALLAANGDPERRFRAAVAWDGYGPLRPARPRVPTMFQSQDAEQAGPWTGEVDPELLISSRQFDTFARVGVESMLIPLQGSTHSEWTYVPERQLNPITAPAGAASRYGERVALYYTRAWLDRHLRPRGRAPSRTERRRVRVAGRRLLACTYDDSIDRFSTGAGGYDPVTGNQPYRIDGLTTDEQIAYRFRSAWSLAGSRGEDLRHDCGETPRFPGARR